jgi:hypothetical protein
VATLPEIAEIKRVTVHPGDRLVVHLDHPVDDAEFERLKREFRKFFGEDVPVLLVEPGIDITVLGSGVT